MDTKLGTPCRSCGEGLKGVNNFLTKAVHLFMNMDKMVGGQFEKGLAQMKSVVEARAS